MMHDDFHPYDLPEWERWTPIDCDSHGFVNPRQLEELWRDQFDWVYREHDHAIFPITVHPDVSGKPQVLNSGTDADTANATTISRPYRLRPASGRRFATRPRQAAGRR